MNPDILFNPEHTGIADPNLTVRNYDLSRPAPLVGLLDNPWYPPYVQDAPHSHNCMEIGLCVSGHGQMTIGAQTWPFSEGTVVVVPKDVRHAQQNMGERLTHWRYVLVNTQAFLLETSRHRRAEAQALLSRIPGGVFLGPEQVSRDIRRTIDELFRVYWDRHTLDSMEMDALTRLLFARLSWVPEESIVALPSTGAARRAVEPALQFISENYALDIRVEEMAAACALSESYFRKIFEQTIGMAPVEYLNRYRVNRAIYLLYTTNETVLTISGLSGFASIASFNRNFMKYVGVTPGRWRKSGGSPAGSRGTGDD